MMPYPKGVIPSISVTESIDSGVIPSVGAVKSTDNDVIPIVDIVESIKYDVVQSVIIISININPVKQIDYQLLIHFLNSNTCTIVKA